MKLVANEKINKQEWEKLLSSNDYSSPFQSLDFYNLFNSINGFSANAFAIEKNSELKSLVVVTIQKEKGVKAFFSRRGIIYGGPLVLNEERESLMILLKSINDYYTNKLIYLEIRNNFSYENFKTVFKSAGWIYNAHLNVQLLTQNRTLDDILKLMKYNRRREVKLSFKHGAIVNVSNSVDEVNQLYEILKELYETRVKLPLPGKNYFQSFLNSTICKVFIVKHKGKVIGGSFCITDNSNSINTLYYAGIRDYHKKIFPTHLAVIGAIDYATRNNIKMVDFMGAGKPNIKYGVRDFKLQFGGDLVEHGRYLKVFNPILYRIGAFGLKLLSKI